MGRIADLGLDAPPPPGVELRPVVGERDIAALLVVSDEVFGGHHGPTGSALAAALARRPRATDAVIAWAAQRPICAGQVEYRSAGDFAGLWGGGTCTASAQEAGKGRDGA